MEILQQKQTFLIFFIDSKILNKNNLAFFFPINKPFLNSTQLTHSQFEAKNSIFEIKNTFCFFIRNRDDGQFIIIDFKRRKEKYFLMSKRIPKKKKKKKFIFLIFIQSCVTN